MLIGDGMRKIVRKIFETIKIYPIWLMVRYFLLEYFYEKKRGKQIEKNLIDEYLWLKEYKNKYAGKRCFVICNGPSLTQEDSIGLRRQV